MKLEINDFRSLITVINVILIMLFGISFAWFGLTISFLGILKDIITDKKINGLIMHSANVLLNIYLLTLTRGF